MSRIIAVARQNGVDAKTGLDLKRGESYQIAENEFDPAVFARPGEDLGEEVKAAIKPTAGRKAGKLLNEKEKEDADEK